MAEEVDDFPATVYSLQMKVHQLEADNSELAQKLLNQNERIERLLAYFSLQKSKTIVANEDGENQQLLPQKEDLEQFSVTRNPVVNKEHKDELTVDKSLHKLPLMNTLGIILPILSAIAFDVDAILFVVIHKPDNDKPKNYAGLISTVLILFYYLQYDVRFNLTHPRLYILYQLLLWVLTFAGDLIYIYYYWKLLHRPFMMSVFLCYAIIDTIWIFLIGYLKFKGYRQHMFIVTMKKLFHLTAMVGQLLIIFIPIFISHEVITTNSMAFFILYEFFSASYTALLDLKYSKLACLCFWLFIIFATIAATCEYFVYAFDQLAEEKGGGSSGHMQSTTASLPSISHYTNIAQYFDVGREMSELLATIVLYSLLVLQFFLKRERKSK